MACYILVIAGSPSLFRDIGSDDRENCEELKLGDNDVALFVKLVFSRLPLDATVL